MGGCDLWLQLLQSLARHGCGGREIYGDASKDYDDFDDDDFDDDFDDHDVDDGLFVDSFLVLSSAFHPHLTLPRCSLVSSKVCPLIGS